MIVLDYMNVKIKKDINNLLKGPISNQGFMRLN